MNKSKILLVTAAMLLASCGGGGGNDTQAVDEAIADAETLTQDELFEKAAEELGTDGKLKIYATTSRGGKDTVKNLFISKLQAYNADITDPLEYTTTVDGQIYDSINEAIDAGTLVADAAILQDGYQLGTKGVNYNYKNFVPKEWNDAADTDKDNDADPFSLQYNFKTIMYNNKGLTDMVIDNVWDITATAYKGKIDTMNPNNENVNMDWLIELTSEDNLALLKEAYEDDTNDSDVDIANYSTYGDASYAYAFIDRFIENAVFSEDDGKAVQQLANAPGDIGWIVYSKLLKIEESTDISKANIVVAALGAENDNTEAETSAMKGFAGFMYKHYLQIMPNCSHPYAACAFFSLISTNKDAYSVWGNDVGDYPSMPSINVDRTSNGYVDGVNTYPCLNDKSSSWWINTAHAVVEDPTFIASNYDNVIDFIDDAIAQK